jgi:HTH-type transcriptional regulator / antitoxin HipB
MQVLVSVKKDCGFKLGSERLKGAPPASTPLSLTSHICYDQRVTAGQLIRATRTRRGLSQERLARRVGTRQSAISRLEADEISPSVETLDLLLRAMGEHLVLAGETPERAYDPVHRRATAERSPSERLALGASWNRMAGRLAAAGKAARERA